MGFVPSSYGLRLRLEGSIVGGLVLGWGAHAKGGVQPPVVVPVDPGHGRELHLRQGLEGAGVERAGPHALGLVEPDDRLHQAVVERVPTLPIEAAMPSSCRCSVNRIARYCDPASEWWTSSPRMTGWPCCPRAQAAMRSGIRTRSAGRVAMACQPTMRWA